MMNSSTPLKAIRQHCLLCMGGSFQYVRECPSTACALYPLRMKKSVKGVSPLQQVRAMCLECLGSPHEVKKCDPSFLTGDTCPLYPYRYGKTGRKLSETELEQRRKARKRAGEKAGKAVNSNDQPGG